MPFTLLLPAHLHNILCPPQEMSASHNRWVNDAVAELQQFRAKLGCVDLTDEVRGWWEDAERLRGCWG